jgi:hypothetical protein
MFKIGNPYEYLTNVFTLGLQRQAQQALQEQQNQQSSKELAVRGALESAQAQKDREFQETQGQLNRQTQAQLEAQRIAAEERQVQLDSYRQILLNNQNTLYAGMAYDPNNPQYATALEAIQEQLASSNPNINARVPVTQKVITPQAPKQSIDPTQSVLGISPVNVRTTTKDKSVGLITAEAANTARLGLIADGEAAKEADAARTEALEVKRGEIQGGIIKLSADLELNNQIAILGNEQEFARELTNLTNSFTKEMTQAQIQAEFERLAYQYTNVSADSEAGRKMQLELAELARETTEKVAAREAFNTAYNTEAQTYLSIAGDSTQSAIDRAAAAKVLKGMYADAKNLGFADFVLDYSNNAYQLAGMSDANAIQVKMLEIEQKKVDLESTRASTAVNLQQVETLKAQTSVFEQQANQLREDVINGRIDTLSAVNDYINKTYIGNATYEEYETVINTMSDADLNFLGGKKLLLEKAKNFYKFVGDDNSRAILDIFLQSVPTDPAQRSIWRESAINQHMGLLRTSRSNSEAIIDGRIAEFDRSLVTSDLGNQSIEADISYKLAESERILASIRDSQQAGNPFNADEVKLVVDSYQLLLNTIKSKYQDCDVSSNVVGQMHVDKACPPTMRKELINEIDALSAQLRIQLSKNFGGDILTNADKIVLVESNLASMGFSFDTNIADVLYKTGFTTEQVQNEKVRFFSDPDAYVLPPTPMDDATYEAIVNNFKLTYPAWYTGLSNISKTFSPLGNLGKKKMEEDINTLSTEASRQIDYLANALITDPVNVTEETVKVAYKNLPLQSALGFIMPFEDFQTAIEERFFALQQLEYNRSLPENNQNIQNALPTSNNQVTDTRGNTLSDVQVVPQSYGMSGAASEIYPTLAPQYEIGAKASAMSGFPAPKKAYMAYNIEAIPQQSITIEDFMLALSARESGGNSQALNTSDGANSTFAQGEFQIMPSNWNNWAESAVKNGMALKPAPQGQTLTTSGGGSVATVYDATDKDNQWAVARNQIQTLYNQTGNWADVALRWYGSPSATYAGLKGTDSEFATYFRPSQTGDEPHRNNYVGNVLLRALSISQARSQTATR